MRAFTLTSSLLATLTLMVGSARASETPERATQQILVDLQDDASGADELALERLIGGYDLRLNSVHADDERMFIADVPAHQAAEIIARLRKDPRVEIAEPNAIYSLIEPTELSFDTSKKDKVQKADDIDAQLAPNDPLWSRQWSFRMVNAAKAWGTSQGEGVVVAVIDTGVAYENYKGFQRVEDLGGTAFVPGYDFVRDTEHPNDDHGHGTHVAGTIAQTTNNGLGVAGIAPKAKIMPLKVLSRRGSGTAADIADAIRFAADEGAQVINMSLG
ncbi:MAG: S8 family serine peptidase, partial [Myxococcota bacterium]